MNFVLYACGLEFRFILELLLCIYAETCYALWDHGEEATGLRGIERLVLTDSEGDRKFEVAAPSFSRGLLSILPPSPSGSEFSPIS